MRVQKNQRRPSIPARRPAAYSPVAAAVLLALGSQAVYAQESGELEEVVVTAQKRKENLQDVPISIEAIGSQKLEEMNIQGFDDYVKILPSVASTPSAFSGAGFSAEGLSST